MLVLLFLLSSCTHQTIKPSSDIDLTLNLNPQIREISSVSDADLADQAEIVIPPDQTEISDSVEIPGVPEDDGNPDWYKTSSQQSETIAHEEFIDVQTSDSSNRPKFISIARRPWHNFEKTVINNYKYLAKPRDTEEVVQVVKWAANQGLQVRPIGSGHSWSQATQTRDLLLATDKMNKLIKIEKSTDPMKPSLVTVQGGMKLKEISKALKKEGLTFSNLGSIQYQSIAGVISTNTHGTGVKKTGFAGIVESFVLVDGRGQIHNVSRESDPDLFYSVCGGIGMLGVITEVTVRVTNSFNIEVVTRKFEISDLIAEYTKADGTKTTKLQEMLDENEWLQTMTIARTNMIIVVTGNRTTKPAKKTFLKAFKQEIARNWLVRPGTYVISMARGRISRGLPKIGRSLINAFINGTPKPKVSANTDAFTSRIQPKPWAWTRESEFFMPRRYAEQVIVRFNQFFEELNAQKNYSPAPFFGMRFVKGDNSYLSSTYIDGENKEFLAVEIYDTKDERYDIIPRAKQALEELIPGQPHLLREHLGKIVHGDAADFKSRYKNWDKFAATVKRVDPKGVFLNDWTSQFFK